MNQLTLSLRLCFLASLAAAAELHPWFGDGMVLQRDQPIRIMGTAAPSERLVVRLGTETTVVVAEPWGRWSTIFSQRAASRTVRTQGFGMKSADSPAAPL